MHQGGATQSLWHRNLPHLRMVRNPEWYLQPAHDLAYLCLRSHVLDIIADTAGDSKPPELEEETLVSEDAVPIDDNLVETLAGMAPNKDSLLENIGVVQRIGRVLLDSPIFIGPLEKQVLLARFEDTLVRCPNCGLGNYHGCMACCHCYAPFFTW